MYLTCALSAVVHVHVTALSCTISIVLFEKFAIIFAIYFRAYDDAESCTQQ